jgi:GT2 family glycosyltransferase
VEILRASYPEVTILNNSDNTGFGQGCNLGMKYALDQGARCIIQLNDDVIVTAPALADLLSVAADHPEYGILIPLQVTEDGTDIDPILAMQLRKYASRKLLDDHVLGRPVDVYPVSALTGAALLVKAEVVNMLGGFDPLFFLQGVEFDYCFRTTISPWEVGFVPRAVVHHARIVRQGKSPPLRKVVDDFYTSSLYTLKRLDHSFAYMLFYQAARSVGIVLLSLKRKAWRRPLAVLIAQPKILVALPRVWRHRRLCLTQEGVFMSGLVIPQPEGGEASF